MSDNQSFSYVIVGAGSAGCVLAARLSENPKNSVCLLEAGPPDRNPWIHVPIGYAKLFKNKSSIGCIKLRVMTVGCKEVLLPQEERC